MHKIDENYYRLDRVVNAQAHWQQASVAESAAVRHKFCKLGGALLTRVHEIEPEIYRQMDRTIPQIPTEADMGQARAS
ncbi:hypothetical protein [Acidocella sp.]|uniref:hypothetical protein n=1 Tax=Acidocella sp. TaxID=50710 RepID=UPI0026071599|nr:hypothetical protein [Acidocella sp.]